MDTKMDTNLARMSESCQNVVRVPPYPLTRELRTSLRSNVMKRYRLIYRGNRDAYYCFDTHTNKREAGNQ